MKWAELGFKFLPIIISAVSAVERLFQGLKGRGQEKQDAAVRFAGDVIATIEGVVAKDIVDDVAVQTAMRKVIDAVVSLQNLIAAKRAAQPTT